MQKIIMKTRHLPFVVQFLISMGSQMRILHRIVLLGKFLNFPLLANLYLPTQRLNVNLTRNCAIWVTLRAHAYDGFLSLK